MFKVVKKKTKASTPARFRPTMDDILRRLERKKRQESIQRMKKAGYWKKPKKKGKRSPKGVHILRSNALVFSGGLPGLGKRR